jgi:hypothetical protein
MDAKLPAFAPIRPHDLTFKMVARDVGCFIEQGQRNPVVYWDTGCRKKATDTELHFWGQLLRYKNYITALELESLEEQKTAVKEERKRISHCLIRASREMGLHQPTLSLCMEIVTNENAEIDLFGGKELT